MTSTTIKLAKPFQHFDTTVAEIEVKEPTGALFTKLGEPRVMVLNATGSGYWVEQPDTIRGYLEQVIKHAGEPALGADILTRLSLEDAKAAKDALLDFFMAAEGRLLARRATSSSSASPQ